MLMAASPPDVQRSPWHGCMADALNPAGSFSQSPKQPYRFRTPSFIRCCCCDQVVLHSGRVLINQIMRIVDQGVFPSSSKAVSLMLSYSSVQIFRPRSASLQKMPPRSFLTPSNTAEAAGHIYQLSNSRRRDMNIPVPAHSYIGIADQHASFFSLRSYRAAHSLYSRSSRRSPNLVGISAQNLVSQSSCQVVTVCLHFYLSHRFHPGFHAEIRWSGRVHCAGPGQDIASA